MKKENDTLKSMLQDFEAKGIDIDYLMKLKDNPHLLVANNNTTNNLKINDTHEEQKRIEDSQKY